MSLSKKTSLIILGLTALVLSRIGFLFINDPEGPNLLIVIVAAAIIYVLSLIPYLLGPSATYPKKFILAILIQILITACFYLLN